MSGFFTKAIHGPLKKKDQFGSLRPPLYDSVAFEFSSSKDLELAFAGRSNLHAYTRISNPTVEELEQRITHISSGLGTIAVASGMAAITNTVIALASAGTNIVTTRRLFGNTLSLFEQTLNGLGIMTKFEDMTDPDKVERAIDDKTALVFLEVISNPQLEVTDIKRICMIADKKGVPVVLDGTLTTPYLFNSAKAGVAVEVISGTKHLSGGATSVGGLITDNGVFEWKKSLGLGEYVRKYGPNAFLMRLRREVVRNTGGCLSPHNAWLHILGLETMGMRIDAGCRNALTVALFLQSCNKVESVNYPGLNDSPWYAAAKEQFHNGFGGLLTFELDGKESCFAFMDNLKIIRKATNLFDNKTLVIHPASTIFAEYSREDRLRMGISDGMVRLSLGIENQEDLLTDIKQGLEKL